jgi:hypothetical protein
MNSLVEFHFDDVLDVVTAQLANAQVVRARPAAADLHLVLKLDDRDQVVGLDLLDPSILRPAFWESHPSRSEIPAGLLREVDAWLRQLWSRPQAPSPRNGG